MNNHKNSKKKALAALMALVISTGTIFPVMAQELKPTSDETYYATLDPYGALLDSSVVKSFRTYGADSITDYGSYSQIINLTDGREGLQKDGQVSFDLSGSNPEQFYFEGKTEQPFQEFPWKLTISYTLNGLPAKAEDLAGEKGLVEIHLDAVPVPTASEYSRNNLFLTAMSAFNGDDILSLEAPGAQVQLLGNLRCALFMIMPGEEQHFVIRVGSDNFSYSGMVFFAAPATLDQLSKVKELKEAKEAAEDSYHAIQDSMDVILNSLEGMSGNLNATAAGLDQLDKGRDIISKGKGQAYGSLDTALDAMGPLTQSMQPIPEHLSKTKEALTETTAALNQISNILTGLRPEVENTRTILDRMDKNLSDLQDLLDDLERYPDRAASIASSLASDFGKLGTSMAALNKTLTETQSQISGLNKKLAGIEGDTEVKVNGMTVDQIRASVTAAKTAHGQYEAALAGGKLPEGTSFQTFLQTAGHKTAEEAAQIEGLLLQSQTQEFQAQLNEADKLNGILHDTGLTIPKLKALVSTVDSKVSPVLAQLGTVCKALDNGGLSGDLKDLSNVAEQLMDDLSDHSGIGYDSLGTARQAASLVKRLTSPVDQMLDQVQTLTNVMNTHEPGVQQALEEAKTLSQAASDSLSALADAGRITKDLVQSSGTHLDTGTKQSLSSLASLLRKAAKGTAQTSTIRNAKNVIDDTITDQWNSHTGEYDNMLLMDAEARPVSLTDQRNEGVQSIQYVMRSQEITLAEAEDPIPTPAPTKTGTVWSRIGDMFRDMWHTIKGWFGK